MPVNPFTPASIAVEADDFFGRSQELQDLERAIRQGSVLIQGPVGIGKSSLLARSRLLLEGFASDHSSETVMAVADRDIATVDQAARLLLECFSDVDEHNRKVSFKLGSVLEIESGDLCRNFAEGRHLAALKRLLRRDYMERLLAGKNLLILAVDEADKCPVPLARLFRSLLTHTQQSGIGNARFIFAGVSPFAEQMAVEDPGISRFVYRTITLAPMDLEDAEELVHSKFESLATEVKRIGSRLEIDPSVVRRIINLSGGHPHILQLLGSHVVQHEEEDPDGIIDARDFHNSLRRICYADRAAVYNAAIHQLHLEDKFDSFLTLLGLTVESPVNICSRTFPTRIDAILATETVPLHDLDWLVRNNVLRHIGDYYQLIDEFLRIRISMDREETAIQVQAALSKVDIDALRAAEQSAGEVDSWFLNVPGLDPEWN